MKVFIIAAITLDGYIARTPNHLASWTSPEDKKHYMKMTKQAGIMVMGSRTFDTIGKPLPSRKTVVYTSHPEKYADVDVEVTSLSPVELVAQLSNEGYKEVAICGGAQIYDLFIDAGVVHELYLTVEPVVFGDGVKLFGKEKEKHLELLEVDKLNQSSLVLHYKVLS